MKILAFTDVHGDLSSLEHIKKEAREKKVDLLICSGDYTFFGDHVEFLTKKLSELGKDIILVHGNHEDREVVEILCKRYKNIKFIHNKALRINNYVFIGHGGGGFCFTDPGFVKDMKTVMKNVSDKDKIVFVAHAPPNKTKLDHLPHHGHVGNKDYREFIKNNNVVLSLCGHIHENFGKEDRIGKARVINPGYKGKIITLE